MRNLLRMPLLACYLFNLVFVAMAEAVFWDEFAVRFNFVAVDYLIYTSEVINNIRQSYPVGAILSTLAIATALLLWQLRPATHQALNLNAMPRKAFYGPLCAALLVAISCSRLETPEFFSNAYANELADNGWRSFVAAARQNRINFHQLYLTREDGQVLGDLKLLSGSPDPSASRQPALAIKPRQRPNVVVIMMESMSADFMAHYGSTENLTPTLDRLSKEGLFFSRMYATGTRTVRGLEALSAALPPQAGAAVVRWPDVGELNTLGSVLAAYGWHPRFIYGGYGMFDNMNGYFQSQGYEITDRTQFQEGLIQFENVWGVADEHLFDQVLIEMDKENAAGRPVMAQVMTTSNHRPFTYPDGRIDIPSPGGRSGGVKYADFALGRFLQAARQKPWFDKTIFLIVADHCASSAGKTRIPVERYRIPAIVYAPKLIQPRQIDTLASQIDLAPTLLALLGLKEASRFVGQDLLTLPPEKGRALLSTYQNLGYLKDNTLTVLSPKRKVETFTISPNDREATPVAEVPRLTREAIAYFQGATLLMKQHQTSGPAR